MRSRTVQYIAASVATSCIVTLPAYAGAATADSTAVGQESSRADGSWKRISPLLRVKGKYWWADERPQKRWIFKFHRTKKKHTGKRQVRVRWQYAKGTAEPKPGRWKNRIKRIRPGGDRRIAFRSKRCGEKLGLLVDVHVRRNKPKRPKRWGKWQSTVAIYSSQGCK